MANFTNEGENWANGILFQGDTQEDLYLRLFTNDTNPNAEAATVGNLTEISGNNYSEQNLAYTSWSGTSQVSYATQTFTCSGGDWGTVYGYYYANQTDTGKLITGEKFTDGPYNLTDGDSVSIVPNITAN